MRQETTEKYINVLGNHHKEKWNRGTSSKLYDGCCDHHTEAQGKCDRETNSKIYNACYDHHTRHKEKWGRETNSKICNGYG